MAIISFGLTTKELLSGKKTVTRRDWNENYTALWQKWYFQYKRIHDAYDKSPRIGGVRIGTIELTALPTRQKLKVMRRQDLTEEGGMVKSVPAFCKLIGKKPNDFVTVIRFKFTPLSEEGK